MRTRIIAIACLMLGACGQRADLAPLANQTTPPSPYGASEAPQVAELLEQETLAAPQRSVELRRRSEERVDDPYDLPPE